MLSHKNYLFIFKLIHSAVDHSNYQIINVYSISQAAFLLGVCPTTIRRWDRASKIRCYRTPGGHRRISKAEIERIIAGKKRRYERKKRGVAVYTRVSSHEQKKKEI